MADEDRLAKSGIRYDSYGFSQLRLFDVLKKSINLPVKVRVLTPTCIRVVNPC